ncbi:hypothetical protein GUJ93_ZPchr0010g8647 [Zizania palustris]|uniref:WAT1-related protein n=1 Tax=Zizania palustris TaxID=103762 RepID=A0A8J5W9L3_ZIZPA|nr:hypothetical protein GUJ93_ZPchr0010g8647 [Zizania palustris]
MKQQGSSSLMHKCKPYVAMISLQFGYAGMNVITKVSLNHGMSHYVLVVYRHAFATLSIAPFALVLERKVRPRMSLWVLLQIFVLALLGFVDRLRASVHPDQHSAMLCCSNTLTTCRPVIDQNFYYAGLKFTSPTFSCAMSNMLPAMTFVMAVIFRMEKVNLKKARCVAKVVGTLVTVAGAILMTLYKGRIVEMIWTKHMHLQHGPPGPPPPPTRIDRDAEEVRRAVVPDNPHLLGRHPAGHRRHLGHGAQYLRGRIGFDMNLLAAAYAVSPGAVFASAFSPLMMIIVAIMGSFILAENIYLEGAIIGSVLIVAGLYSVLWGKHKENMEKVEEMEIPVAIKGAAVDVNGRVMDIVELDDVQLEKAQANGKASEHEHAAASTVVAVTVPADKTRMHGEDECKLEKIGPLIVYHCVTCIYIVAPVLPPRCCSGLNDVSNGGGVICNWQ